MNNIRNRNVRTIFGGIGIAMLLCVLMLMMSWSAVVQNSDINAIENQSTEDEKIVVEDTKLELDNTETGFDPQALGFDEDNEMLGMRTENTKTYYQDGNLEMVISNKPLHFENSQGQLVEIDTSLKSTDFGYEVVDSTTKFYFSNDLDGGFHMDIADGVELTSGLNPRMVIVSISEHDEFDENGMVTSDRFEPLYFELETDFETSHPQIGGSSISHAIDHHSFIQYHVSQDSIKQDLRIDLITPEQREHLDFIHSSTDTNMHLGLTEDLILPDGTGLFENGKQIINTNGRIQLSGPLDIVNIETGHLVAQIAPPVSYDAADADEEFIEDTKTSYFIIVDETGQNVELTTAVEYEWLIDENTNFPVVIDPSITNTYNIVNSGSNFNTCQPDFTASCFDGTGGSSIFNIPGTYYYGSSGDHASFPLFDFDITTPNSFTVKSITANIDRATSSPSGGSINAAIAGLVVLEDCGGTAPITTDSDNWDGSNGITNPSGCGAATGTYTAIPEYVAPPSGGGGPTTYTLNNRDSSAPYGGWYVSIYSGCASSNSYRSLPFNLASFMDNCNNGRYMQNQFFNPTGPDHTAGVFSSGGYEYTMYDQYSDGMDGNSAYQFWIAPTGTGTPWKTTSSTNGLSAWSLLKSDFFRAGASDTGTVSVPAGYDMFVAYDCNQGVSTQTSGGCYYAEQWIEITPAVVGPTLPGIPSSAAAACSPNCVPTGSESPTASLTLTAGKEAYMEWTLSGSPGGSENEIYYRTSGATGWTNVWDICGASCTAGATYNSYNDNILFQTPDTYEFLVWDTNGDGTGANSGGSVVIADLGSTTGVTPLSPSELRWVSLVSTEQVGYAQFYSNTPNPNPVSLCTTVTDCSTGSLSIIADAVNNGGYFEMTLLAPHLNGNYVQGAGSFDTWGRQYINDFYLTIELEDNTPDSTPPSVENGQYTGNSYVEGARTLYLDIKDTENNIDTTTANAPKLHYSTDGGNTFTPVPTTLIGSCSGSDVVCSFSASTGVITEGTTVDYYWTYTDAALVDPNKVPPQSPNAGRSPATGTHSFSVLDINNAPTDGTSMKLITKVDNVYAAYDSGSKSSNGGTVDRQMTYFTSTGEFLFEFGLEDCGVNMDYGASLTEFEQCFSDRGGDFGHYDMQWEGTATDCYPGSPSCTSAPTNSLDLFTALDVTEATGSGNLLFSYDSSASEWAVTSLGANGINDELTAAVPNVNSEAHSALSNPANTDSMLIPAFGYGTCPGTVVYIGGSTYNDRCVGDWEPFTVPTGNEARFSLYTGTWAQEVGILVRDANTQTILGQWGRIDNDPAVYANSACDLSSCSLDPGTAVADNSFIYSDDTIAGVHNSLPNSGVFAPGSYEIQIHEILNDGTNGLYVRLQSQVAGSPWVFGDANQPTFSQSGSEWVGDTFVIDLATSSTSLGSNTGFAGVPFGSAAGEFNTVCVTTNGHVMFKESTTLNCPGDAQITSDGLTQWQGFAIGATVQGEQLGEEGLLWLIRDAKPDPDIVAPVIGHGDLGDSHAQDRNFAFTISDTGYAQEGLDSSGVPGQGPTMYYEIVAEGATPTGVYTPVALTPPTIDGMTNSEVRTLCSTTDCTWTTDLTGLTRGSSVVYYATAQDIATLGSNVQQTSAVTFEVANPTKSLVLEWVEYNYGSSGANPCSMQVAMYDVTNEFEFHYESASDCFVLFTDAVGLVGHRLDSTSFQQIRNFENTAADPSGNPHNTNFRFTLTDSGTYSVETFALGIANPLPLTASTQVVTPDSGFNVDSDCYDSTSTSYGFNAHSDHCAGLFDIPDDFTFDFWGATWDGAQANNQIHVSASGMLYFTNNPQATLTVHQGQASGATAACWGSSGAMCGMSSTDSYFPTESMMAPFWSREANDFCQTGTDCEGVYYRTMPFDGQGKTVTADIDSDEIWYLIDSPIKINPSSPDGYLSVNADLTIEAGVEVIVAEGRGISFDGGAGDADDATCANFIADGDENNRITFNVDRSVNSNALWHGLAFTDDCGGAGETGRHVLDNVDISNTEYAAITAGSRPAPQLDGSAQTLAACGNSATDCDTGEFLMTAVTFSNVDTAFSHGSGQGTTVNMDNFAVTDARSACFNFAENTVATLTGSASTPSTMTRCNTNKEWWGGAIVSTPGSSAGSLTMSYVDISESYVSGIRTDLKSVSIDNVDIVNTNPQYPIREYQDASGNTVTVPVGDQVWQKSGVSLEFDHAGPGSQIVISDFSAPGYHHGRICSTGTISLTNVDLGTGLGPAADGTWTNYEDFFDIKSADSNGCGGNNIGTFGADSTFNNFDVGNLYIEGTFPSVMSQMEIDGELIFRGLTFTGAPADPIMMNDVSIADKFEVDTCGANIEASDISTPLVKSACTVPGGMNFVTIKDSTIAHTDTFLSAIEMEQTRGTMIDVAVTSTTINSNGPYIAYGLYDSDMYLVEVTLNTDNCADNTLGMSTTCHVGKASVGISNTIPVMYVGSYASATAYRLANDASTTPPTPYMIPQQDVTITASTLDSTGTEVFGHQIGSDLTDANGLADKVVVITGDDSGNVFDSHHVRASGPAGAGEAHPLLVDGTQATDMQFVNGVLQDPLVPFGTYNIGSSVDIRLTAPPVTFNDPVMDCAWMATNQTFVNVYNSVEDKFIFKGATMVLAESMSIDTCDVVLEGSKLIFRQNLVSNPTLTVTGTGSLTLKLDPDTGDLPKIQGEGNNDAVDLAIGSGGVVDFQAGTLKNLMLDNSKSGLVEVPEGATLKLGGNAFVYSQDTSTMATQPYPVISIDAGLLEVNSATISGTNVGVGVYNANKGQISGAGLTIVNMDTGIHSYFSSIELDDYTSTDNTNGIIAEGSPSLPEIYGSAVLQGITTNTPYSAASNGMDHCRGRHHRECFQWETYTVDLSSWVGVKDFIQPSMMLNYDGSYRSPYSRWSSIYPYVSMDNLRVTMTDSAGNSWDVDGSNNGVGYYPYSNSDPAVVNGGATYLGGQGGAAAYDCNLLGESITPWRVGTAMDYPYTGYFQTMGTTYGTADNGYGEAFGYRWVTGTSPHTGSSFHTYPRMLWGIDEPFTGRYGPGANGASYGLSLTNEANYKTTSTSSIVYEVCSTFSSRYTVPGLNTMLEWPVVDLRDTANIESVELSFDFWHRYTGAIIPGGNSWASFYNNNNADSLEVLARSGSNPADLGDYSKEVEGLGTTISNSAITGANTAVDIRGDVLATLSNIDIDDPTSFAVKVSGANDIVMDGLDVDDSSAGANNNYGFYTTSTATGSQVVQNSNFNGMGTAIYVNNDVETSITNTVVANGDVGIKIGSQSEANHQFSDLTMLNNDVAILADGIGEITMTDVDIQGSVTNDLVISDSNQVEFLDGEIDQAMISIDSAASGSINRDRSYFAVMSADGNPLANANVIMSSADAASSSSGVTDSNGVTSGLKFAIYSMDNTNIPTDYSQFFTTYSLSSVAMVTYSYTDISTNDADFRYIQTSPTLVDAPYDSSLLTNYQPFALTNNIDVRVCSNDATSLVVANCAGTLANSGDRAYTNGMLEFGDDESIDGTVDLTNKAIMIDTGLFELMDGVTYDMSNSVVFHTGVDTQFGGGGVAQWISDAPYGTVVKMHGGEINGLMQDSANGEKAGLIIGGLQGTTYENPMGLDFDGATLNNIAGLATSNGDLTTGAWSGLSAYQPSIISIKDSFINHYRGYFYYPSQYFDLDYCIRLQGGDAGYIGGNTLSDCTMGVVFMDSAWHSTGSTSQTHSQVGADGIQIDDNTFVGASGWNVYAWPDADADFIEITDNDMSCSLCGHIRFRDDSSVSPTIEDNTFNNGQYGVYTSETEYVVIKDNTFNNQENMAIRANEGDFDAEDNTINNPGEYAIYADSLEKPDEIIETVVAGINSPQPDDGVSFTSCSWGTVTCADVQATLGAGEEMIMKVTCGSYCYELRVDWKDPSTGSWSTWDPTSGYPSSGTELYSNVDGTANYVLSGAGTWFFNLWDTFGDGINGGALEIIKANTGAWSGGVNTNPVVIYDPANSFGGTPYDHHHTKYQGNDQPKYPYTISYYYSNTDVGQTLQNTGTTDLTYEFRMADCYSPRSPTGNSYTCSGDGANNNYFEIHTSQVGTWSSTAQGPTGTYAGGINDGRSGSPSFGSGTLSDAITVTIAAGDEARFTFYCTSFCHESYLQWQEVAVVSTAWDGPTISNNDINFDVGTANNPLAVGLYLSNCEMADYAITTISNTIDIGQNAVENQGCIWTDVNSVITGGDISGSIGYNDDNAYSADLELDGTTISGFGTGIYKTTSGNLFMTGGATVTAGTGGIGVHTKDIDVRTIGAAVDGGATGTGMLIEDSTDAWVYPLDVSGNIGLHTMNTELLWEGGNVDADTVLKAETTTGTVESLVDTGTGTQIDAGTDTMLTVVDYSLDETRMTVDTSSTVYESNWLNIDADHLGAEPSTDVGLIMTSDSNYAAFNSPTFNQMMNVDGDSSDWVGGNALNPSGYAMPGAVGGGMLVTKTSSDLFVGFDQASTASSDVYVYIDSADGAGSDTGLNGVHTLPSAADYLIKATSTSTDLYSYSGTAWNLESLANVQSAENTILEVSVPLAEIDSGADSISIVGVVQDVGADTMTATSPTQSITGTGPESLTDSYDLVLNKLDLTNGLIADEVVLHRSFAGSSTPSPQAGHTYTVMVKTPAEVRHSCDYDWATEENVVMDSTTSLTFDILRACPEITNLLDDITVDEDSNEITFDLATYVDDVQDVEASMLWSVAEVANSMDAHDGILSDFNGPMVDATGTFDLTPINDQFGTFELTFEVVDSHGQTASKTITYTVNNINDAPVICDARADVDPNCDNGQIHIYTEGSNGLYNVRNEGFGSYSKLLGDIANDTANSFIRDMENEQFIGNPPVAQNYFWTVAADCDQMVVSGDPDSAGNSQLTIIENTDWEEGGVCTITLDLEDNGAENTQATSVDVDFSVAPVNDVPEICDETTDASTIDCLVESTDSSNAFNADGANYRLTLVEDTTDVDALTFDLANIKSDIDHVMADLEWELTDTNSCTSLNYFTHSISGDTLNFDLIPDATTNAQPWEVDKLNNNGIHQTRTATGYCEMTLTLSDSPNAPSYMPNYTAVPSSNYVQESVSVTLSVKVDNVAENVPDYYLDATEGFDFNKVSNVMPGTYVPVDFSINAGGDEGPYTYDHLLIVELHSDGHTESELPRIYTPPAYGQSLDIEAWEVYITDQTTEVWVEIDVVTCEPGAVCTPAVNTIQNDNPESHNGVSSATVFGKWSEPGRIGESADGTQSNRRPAFEDKNWCNNLMSTNSGTEGVAWSDATSCGHSDQGYNGAFAEDWQTADNVLPVTVSTIGALSVASFAPSIIAVALTGLFVSALVFAGRRDDDEEEIMEQKMSDDETAVSPVIATILMVAITVVLSGVVYVWAAQLAETDAKGVPRVTFTAEIVDTPSTDSDHWKITVGQAQTALATQAMEVTVTYTDGAGDLVSEKINLASTQGVYGFSPFNSDSLVTFGDVVTVDGGEVISTFSTGDDIYVKTHLSDGTPLVDATIVIAYQPPGDAQKSTLKTYTGLSWNQPV